MKDVETLKAGAHQVESRRIGRHNMSLHPIYDSILLPSTLHPLHILVALTIPTPSHFITFTSGTNQGGEATSQLQVPSDGTLFLLFSSLAPLKWHLKSQIHFLYLSNGDIGQSYVYHREERRGETYARMF